MRWKERLEKWADGVRFFASRRGYTCDGCGREVFSYPVKRLCDDCGAQLSRNEKSVCPKCGRRTVAEGLCLDCKARPPRFERGFSPFSYTGLVAGMLNRFKEGQRHLAWFFGEAMAASAADAIAGGGLIVPEKGLLILSVPASERRRRERGYDQAAELAKVVGRLLSSERSAGLVMVRETRPQKKLTARERRANADGAYRADRKACAGRTVLLVDDLMTTGATADACTRALLKAGAERVYFLSAASVPERPPVASGEG